MELTFLGSGNFFTYDNFHSNILLRHNGKGMLIDAGSDLRHSLAAANCTFEDIAKIDTVFISHLHDDHCGGLEWLGFLSHFVTKHRIRLVLHTEIFQYLWPCRLIASMGELRDPHTGFVGSMKLDDYFDVDIVEEDFFWQGEDTLFRLERSPHIMDTFGLHCPEYGFFFSGDCSRAPSQFANDVAGIRRWNICQRCKLIFHDCETHSPPSGAHAHINDLLQMTPEVKAKTWLYHLSDGARLPSGFAGIVRRGQTFQL